VGLRVRRHRNRSDHVTAHVSSGQGAASVTGGGSARIRPTSEAEVERSRELVDGWRPGDVIDVDQEFLRLAAGVMGDAIFGPGKMETDVLLHWRRTVKWEAVSLVVPFGGVVGSCPVPAMERESDAGRAGCRRAWRRGPDAQQPSRHLDAGRKPSTLKRFGVAARSRNRIAPHRRPGLRHQPSSPNVRLAITGQG